MVRILHLVELNEREELSSYERVRSRPPKRVRTLKQRIAWRDEQIARRAAEKEVKETPIDESNNDQRDRSHVSTVTNDQMRSKLDAMGGSRKMSDLPDPRPQGFGRDNTPLTPKEKLKATYRAGRVRRTENFKGAINQGKSAISQKYKKGWKGATLPAEKAVQDTAKWPNPSGSAHVLSRGVKKVKGAKPLPGEVHGEEKDMARPQGEGGEVTRNLVARNLNKKREGGTQVVPKTPPFQSHDDNIRSMRRMGDEYAGTPSKKDKMPERRKPTPNSMRSTKVADVNKPKLTGTTYSQG